MAGRRRFARVAVTSMGWWWCLIILAIGGCRRGVLAADSAAIPQPSAAVPHAEEGGCSRPLSDVIWGFLVTLFALIVSFWGSWKQKYDNDASTVCQMTLSGVLDPLVDLLQVVGNSLCCVSYLWNCHKLENPNSHIASYSWFKFLCSSLSPWSKSPVRILASCEIVVYVSAESPLLEKEWLWRESLVKDESQALVVGENWARAIPNDEYERKELSASGIGVLLWKEVFFRAEDSKCLPKYDELKYLRGNSGFAIVALAAQALGYTYAVGFRVAENLRISPLEVIGMIFNTILLIKILFYSFCNPCHRPLVIYMNGDWALEVGQCDDHDQKKFDLYDTRTLQIVIFSVIFVVLNTLLIYSIVNVVRATNVLVGAPLILFLLGFWLVFLAKFIVFAFFARGMSEDNDLNLLLGIFGFTGLGVLVNGIAYIWSIVGTVLYWKTMYFNTRADLINLSQIIPFIG